MDGLLFLEFELGNNEVVDIPIREPRVLWERENPFLRFNDTEFSRNFRLSKASLLALVNILREDLDRPNKRGLPLSPEQQVCLCLQYLATGTSKCFFASFF